MKVVPDNTGPVSQRELETTLLVLNGRFAAIYAILRTALDDVVAKEKLNQLRLDTSIVESLVDGRQRDRVFIQSGWDEAFDKLLDSSN